jgi:hypothetical protein
VVHVGAVCTHSKDGLLRIIFAVQHATVASFKVQLATEALDATVAAFRINRKMGGGILTAALVVPGIGVGGLGVHPAFCLQELKYATFTGGGI